MEIRNLMLGLTIGAVAVGGVWWSSASNEKRNDELFANKQKCAQYTEKRTSEEELAAERGPGLLSSSVTVEGFYSPIANTCMTATFAYVPNSHESYSLIDELTGRVEASALIVKDQKILREDPDLLVRQTGEVGFYLDKVRYFKGLAPDPDPSKYQIQ
ncbi:MAG: hypothetical protein Q7S76_01550 [bacterium]|nr:hypothetical protein [bacterium]